MPWLIKPESGEFCIYKENAEKEAVGESLGCHKTRAGAIAQLRALYSAVGEEARNMEEYAFSTNRIMSVQLKEKDGRSWLVAPMVALVQGVVNGELVKTEILRESAPYWNGRPLPIGHPTMRGAHVSANSPDIKNYGAFYNATVEDDKLKGEAWFDIALLDSTDEGKELKQRLESNQMIEVSTAYWRDLLKNEGVYGNKRFEGEAVALRPDHIAVLLHTEGACSKSDGCGVPRANESDGRCECEGGKDEVKFNDNEDQVSKLESFADSIVKRITEVFTSQGDRQKENTMQELINRLISNERNKLEPEQLATMNEGVLETLAEMLEADVGEIESETDAGEVEVEADEVEEITEESADDELPGWALEMQNTLSTVVSRIDELAANAVVTVDNKKDEIVQRLIANKACPFDEQELTEMSESQLVKLESALKPTDYSGRGGFIGTERGELVEMPTLVYNGK